HLFSGHDTPDILKNIINISNEVLTSKSTQANNITNKINVTVLVKPPMETQENIDIAKRDGIMMFFQHLETETSNSPSTGSDAEKKHPPLCISNDWNIHALSQTITCCLATGRDFKFGAVIKEIVENKEVEVDKELVIHL